MTTNVDAAGMRRINLATVLGVIRGKRTTSRIDISQITGLNKATVSYLVDELIQEQLVQEIGYGSSSGGRKPVLLKFNANAAYAIGIDIQITHMTTVVSNTRGEVVYRQTKPLALDGRTSLYQQRLVDLIVNEAAAAMKATPPSPHGLAGIGVALPGIVNFSAGTVYYLPNASISDWNLQEALGQHFKVPVFIDNDANCGAWCEFQHRNSRVQHLVHINAGVGVGAGVIVNGQLYRGKDGLAGEFGHMTIAALGRECSCGNCGCWEEYASERSLLRYIREAGGEKPGTASGWSVVEQILYEAQHDNRAYIRAFHTLGEYLGVGIANILNGLNPEQVTIGGMLSRAATFILPEIERVLQQRAILLNKSTPLTIANANAVAIGAAEIVIDQTLFSYPKQGSICP
ncbi:MAG: ROK family transcriptional regulator [Bacilli bacterium]